MREHLVDCCLERARTSTNSGRRQLHGDISSLDVAKTRLHWQPRAQLLGKRTEWCWLAWWPSRREKVAPIPSPVLNSTSASSPLHSEWFNEALVVFRQMSLDVIDRILFLFNCDVFIWGGDTILAEFSFRLTRHLPNPNRSFSFVDIIYHHHAH